MKAIGLDNIILRGHSSQEIKEVEDFLKNLPLEIHAKNIPVGLVGDLIEARVCSGGYELRINKIITLFQILDNNKVFLYDFAIQPGFNTIPPQIRIILNIKDMEKCLYIFAALPKNK